MQISLDLLNTLKYNFQNKLSQENFNQLYHK